METPETTSHSSFTNHRRRIAIILWITYAIYYLGRLNITVAFPGLSQEFGITEIGFGLIGLAFFWSYAFGQLVNGQLGDRFGAKVIVALGLFFSSVLNLVFPNIEVIASMIVIWGLNGYAQSMGWGPIVKTLANWYPPHLRGKLSGRIGTSYILGGAASVAVAGYATQLLGWKAIFYVPPIIMLLAAVIWCRTVSNSPEDSNYDPIEVGGESPTRPDVTTSVAPGDDYLGLRYTLSKTIASKQSWLVALSLFFLNMVRYGFLVWAPTYLFSNYQMGIGRAAFSSLVFPLAGALGALSAGWATDRFFQSRRAPVACICAILTGIFAAGFSFMSRSGSEYVSLFLLASTGFVVFGAHVLIVGALPMDVGTRKAAASTTGFVDCIGYVGAGLSSVVTGILTSYWGWSAALSYWTLAAILSGAFTVPLWHYRRSDTAYI